MALYSLFKITALCALFQAAAAAGTPACSGTRTETYQPSSPDGVYSQSNIDVYGTKVKYIDVVFHPVCAPPAECVVPLSETVTYKMDLEGCMIVGDMCIPFPGEMHKTFTDGRFIDLGNNKGAMFIPRSSEPLNPINELLKIQWCPDQNYFLVKLAGQLLEPLRHQATVFSTVAAYPDASGPVIGSICTPGLPGACGSGTRSSTLECVPPCIFAITPPPPATCQPRTLVEGSTCCSKARPCPSDLYCQGSTIALNPSVCVNNPYALYLDTVCLAPPAVGTCGSALYPNPSGLSCKCDVFGSKETCKCRPALA